MAAPTTPKSRPRANKSALLDAVAALNGGSSRDAAGNPSTEPIGRAYFTLRSEVIGPVFNKIWDTPGSVTIERMKKKYGGSVEAALEHLGRIQDEFDRLWGEVLPVPQG